MSPACTVLTPTLNSIGGAHEAVILTRPAVTFETDAELQEFYKPIPTYEGFHRYDPQFEWSDDEENKVIRKVGLPRLPFLLT